MKKGISDTVFIPGLDTETFLIASGKAGFAGVELNFREKEGKLDADTTSAQARVLAQMATDNGLEIVSLSTQLFNDYPLSSSDTTLREKGKEIAIRMIELATEMETKLIQIVPGVLSPDQPYQTAYDLAQQTLLQLATEASAADITIGIENVSNKFLPSPLEFVRFLDEINQPCIQAYFDSGNAMVTGYPDHFIDLLSKRIAAIHMKNYRQSTGDFVSALDGDINLRSMMHALRKIPYKGYVIMTPPYPSTYCSAQLIEIASLELTEVLNLSEQ
ncbi:sugar phosphate isomerase/epimerase family protein [Salicibibacter kimchii]|uniref:Sugar phosphate isomerase/epimerase n=1 Tax=Salicibibacter kimchii TaxID=2099786 RepID=A0A345BWG8_9BACI|nr:sugar phosphate isomerase/epimerase family protein [Salicibibacter kimchii]AXF55299.1 sugar phosphate isomerase/epimerase [Salicibibacter kimchii]